MAASSAAWMNEPNERGVRPRSSWVWSVKGIWPNIFVSTSAAAEDCTEWPDVYSGNGGVTRSGVQAGSMRARMYVTGRSRLSRYLVFQQQMNASATANPTFTYASAAFSSEDAVCRIAWVRMEMECPGGVGVLPGSSDQNRAISRCSGVSSLTVS